MMKESSILNLSVKKIMFHSPIKPQAVGEIMISNSEYTNDLTKNTSNDTLPVESISNDYFIWLVLGGVLIIVAIVVIIIMRKIKK